MPGLEEVAPKYRQLAQLWRDQILRGDLKPGDELPSERAMADQYGVSRPTATKALDLLRREGFAESRQGAGTYVADPSAHRRARERYQRSRETGKIYPADEYAVIVAAESVDPGPRRVTEALGLAEASAVVMRCRVTRNAVGPVELSTSWFPGALAMSAPLLLRKERILEGTVAYVERMVGRSAEYARDRVAARSATSEEAEHLELPSGPIHPVMVVQHIVCDASDRPIEFAEAVYPAGRWAYEQQYALPK